MVLAVAQTHWKKVISKDAGSYEFMLPSCGEQPVSGSAPLAAKEGTALLSNGKKVEAVLRSNAWRMDMEGTPKALAKEDLLR
jgi:hypothetical protein